MGETFKEIINDIRKSLDNDCYYAALSLALTLPDICGQAEYPKAALGKRYIDWYDEHIGKYAKQATSDNKAYLRGEVLYNLRCQFLHKGNPDIDKEKIKDERNQLYWFSLFKEEKGENKLYRNVTGVVNIKQGENSFGGNMYRVNVRGTCLLLADEAEKYYNNNKEKFDFLNSPIFDLNEAVKKQNDWPENAKEIFSMDNAITTRTLEIIGRAENGNQKIKDKIEISNGYFTVSYDALEEITPSKMLEILEVSYIQGQVSEEKYAEIKANLLAELNLN